MTDGAARTLEHLERLIGFASVTDAPNLPIVDYLQDFLAGLGFAVHRMTDGSGQRAGLFASAGPAGPGGVLLSGHTDVVPVTGQDWQTDPFKLRVGNGRAYGRGTTDMKGFLACVLSAAEQAAGGDLVQPFKIAFSYDEEIGCVGIRRMIDQLAPFIGLPEYCIVGEPTTMQVAVGHKGKAALRALCTGTGGHSAMAPDFLNALHLATDFIAELRTLQAELAETGPRDADYGTSYSTIHVGKISGGVALNIVPDKAVVEFEFRHLAAQSAEDLLDRISRAAARIVDRYKPGFPVADILIEPVNDYPGLDTAVNSDVVRKVTTLTQTETTKVAYGTEAGYFSGHLGIPTIVCGPGNMDQGHKPDEFIEVDQLARCDAMLTRLLAGMR